MTGTLTPAEDRLLRGEPWSISAIVLWEIAKLAQIGRIEVDLDDRQVEKALTRADVRPTTTDIAKTRTRLDVRGDTADELIAATSIVHDVPLVTRERVLRRSRKNVRR